MFSKCAESLEEGRRLENLSWRIWNRETLCCETQPHFSTTPAIGVSRPTPSPEEMPELSSSIDSVASDASGHRSNQRRATTPALDIVSPSMRCEASRAKTSTGKERHISSLHLEKMVFTIKEKKELQPLSPSIADAVPNLIPSTDITPRATSPTAEAPQQLSGSSASTAPSSSPESDDQPGHSVGSDTSAEFIASHSVVRGFSPSHISSSFRSYTHLAPEPIPTTTITHAKAEETRKKGGMFMLGGSSGEDESSFEEEMSTKPRPSSIKFDLQRPTRVKKQTSFRDEVESRTISNKTLEDEEVFESDEEEDASESAIDDDDDDSEWEDSPMESGESSIIDKPLFQRVDSRPNLTSRRSLLTTLMHQSDRAVALQNIASQSTPALRRSRTSSPNGPSLPDSPDDGTALEINQPGVTAPKPIIITTSNTHPPALSPKTTRRNMLGTELTESLRKHLLWERQQKSSTANAVLKRRHTAHDVTHLQQFPDPELSLGSGEASKTNSWNHYFDYGLGEYHQRGW